MARPIYSHPMVVSEPRQSTAHKIQIVNSNTTLTRQADIVLADSTSGDINVTLPAVSAVPGKQILVYKIVNANKVNVNRAGADLITYGSALTTVQLVVDDAKTLLISDGGSTWLLII